MSVPVGLTPVTAAAATGGLGRPDLPEQRVSEVEEVKGQGAKEARARVAKETAANNEQAVRARKESRAATWPKPGSAELPLRAKGTSKAAPGGLPVTLRPTGKSRNDSAATLRVLDQKTADRLGIKGVVLTAQADEARQAELTLDYGAFASALGGGWASRLQLVQLPACALTTPEKSECRKATALPSRNDGAKQTLSAEVKLTEAASDGLSPQLTTATTAASSGATVLAATATSDPGSGEAANGSGDYSATELSASSSWEAGGSSGSFTWSYDFTMPPAAAGPSPKLSLSYDSGSVDGRTATTNNQGTSVGEGFSLTESYIERSYGACDDDGHADVFDRCWKYDNASLVLNGKASRLVKDDSTGQWRLLNDDDSKVIRSTGADNGDDNGEYWTVITGDGTKYVFGLNKLDGAGTQRTNSTWTVPVFGDDSGEPGYSKGSSFSGRSLTQAWRWNLDYIEDTSGNAATYWYTKETNHYKKNKASTANASYVRGGYLTEVKYGLRKGALFSGDADAKVTFSHAERCTVSNCTSLTKDTAENWPDVPFDAICSSGASDCKSSGPTFFSRKRVTAVHTHSWDAATSAYKPVDSWALSQQYLDGGDIGDTSDHVLTLKSLKRTAKAGTAITLPPVSFTYQMRPNRVDGTDDILPLTRPRISTVTSETGAITTVTLSSPECVRSQVLGAAEDTNTRNCYPQFWNINGSSEASVDWFQKYRVTAVTVSDPAGQNDAVEHEYVYSGAAWHHSDEPFTPKDERTWSEWRGYRQVTVHSGAKDTTRSRTVSLYLQGMDGDKLKNGTTRSVSVAPLGSPSLGLASIKDSSQYAGQLRQQVTYDGATAVSASASEPWSKETARQTVPGAGDHVARFVRVQKSTQYTYLTAPKKWRSATTSTQYDSHGTPYLVEGRGDDARTGDETCTRTWYARNASAGLSLASRTRTVGKPCSVADTGLDLPADTTRRGDVLSDTATAYDGLTWSTSMQPTKGMPTWTGRAKAYGSTGTPVWQKTSGTTYDALGRPLTVTDAADQTTSTAYTPATDGPLTKSITTNPKGHRSADFIDPRRGLTLRSYDINLKKTELAYDALGRLTDVWLPNRAAVSTQAPNQKFRYNISATQPSWVSTGTLKADGDTYNTTYALYDALLRPLQTQSPTPQGGRLLTDTRYDSRGLAYETFADIFDNTKTPNGTYTRAEYGEAPTQTQTVFDGAGRATESTLLVFGQKKWSTTSTYTGDSTATTAVKGGTAARTITDALGRTVETREYAGQTPADTQYGAMTGVSYSSVTYTHTLDGKERTITGPDGAKWSRTYDLFGRLATDSDPDKGTSRQEYDAADRVIRATNSKGVSILTEYDELGRTVGTWSGQKTDAKQLTSYTYDTLLKGLVTSSTRYVGGRTGAAYTKSVTKYDSMSRPTDTRLTLPDTDPLVKAGNPATIDLDSYYRIDGTLANHREPALGGLGDEIIDYTYNGLGMVTKLGGSTGYLLDVDYSALGQPQQLTLGTGNTEAFKKSYLTNTYEEGTGRLLRSHVTDQTHPYMLQDLTYTYDQAGNVTSIADPTTLGGKSSAETQCFAYDGHRRMTEAWTPASQNCADPRNASSLSGPAPYWTSYTYNKAGQRTTETQHKSSGNTTTTYCYKGTQPHAVTGTSKTANCATPDSTYTYDSTGNTTTRPGPNASQSLTWTDEGQLSELTESGKSTDYIYDADGTLLIRSTQGGERVLYVGATELHLRANGTKWAQRSYSFGGQQIALRTNESGTQKLHYLAGDRHGTSTLSIASESTQPFVKRHMTPFGAPRGSGSSDFPGDKAFLGKTADKTTGLTHIGARQYDPTLGQFISVDPLLSLEQHQSLNGYSYANNSPVTSTDPTGLAAVSCQRGSCSGEMEAADASMSMSWGAVAGGAGGGSSGAVDTNRLGTVSSGGNRLASPWQAQTRPIGNYGDLKSLLADYNVKDPYGIIADYGSKRNPWETSRALFFGWLWGGGYPLKPTQEFRGGDAFTGKLAGDETFSRARVELVNQAIKHGMDAPNAKEPLNVDYKDVGPEPGSPWWKFNSIRGAANDVSGVLSNGAIGTRNQADAFLGTYDGSGKIVSVDRKEGVAIVEFHATNLSDWRSATHLIPRSWNPMFEDTFGAPVRQNFEWRERLPLNSCVCWVQ
ncbi:RHS repeat-associated core domain-containing protein [Streptomyces sp. MUM 203J]|uniref:RHS repeat domain-containing protein n=1 Tax=Streptomyces sp. MUM 203J TaxID=2791990 RepID=UPI001F048F7D|nr:RHS repeat-associated core domain-containing protein [Streptomyces sp. MUM 203J]